MTAQPDTFTSRRADKLPVRARLLEEAVDIFTSYRMSRRNLLEVIPAAATRERIVSGEQATRWHMVTDPEANQRVLRERVEDYPKSDVTKNILRPAVGDSMFIAEGEHWRWQRRAAAPAFGRRTVMGLGPVMTHAAERAAARLEASVGRAADMHDEMVRTTFEIIADVTFSRGGGFDRSIVHRSVEEYIASTAKVTLLDVLGAPDWVPRPNRVWAERRMSEMKTAADEAVAKRAAEGADGAPDFLDMLLAAEDPKTGRRMDPEDVRNNLLTFIVAGHETTALALSWALYLAAFDPEEQDAARTEAQAVLGDRAATADDIMALPRTRHIIDEALRLYPPGAFISRLAREPDTLAGTEILPGDTVILPIYALHRNRLWWDDPDAFRPSRWERPDDVHRFAYLPFGDGPRVCIGQSFALQEAVIILATLLARYRVSPVRGRDPKPVMILTLRPENGIWLEVERA